MSNLSGVIPKDLARHVLDTQARELLIRVRIEPSPTVKRGQELCTA